MVRQNIDFLFARSAHLCAPSVQRSWGCIWTICLSHLSNKLESLHNSQSGWPSVTVLVWTWIRLYTVVAACLLWNVLLSRISFFKTRNVECMSIGSSVACLLDHLMVKQQPTLLIMISIIKMYPPLLIMMSIKTYPPLLIMMSIIKTYPSYKGLDIWPQLLNQSTIIFSLSGFLDESTRVISVRVSFILANTGLTVVCMQ